MKTEEFIKRITKLGYTVKVGKGETRVSSKTGCIMMALVSEVYKNMADLVYVDNLSDDLFDAIVSYAKTPISERRAIIRKRVKVIPTDKNSYLHICYLSYKQEAYLGSLADESLTNVMTDFSPEQIEQLKSREDVAIDWDKAVLEEVN